jgi:hypothetical protein
MPTFGTVSKLYVNQIAIVCKNSFTEDVIIFF